jgi:hypothetical protein
MATSGLTAAERKLLEGDLVDVDRALSRVHLMGSTAIPWRALQNRLRTRLNAEDPAALHQEVQALMERDRPSMYWMQESYEEEGV